MLTLFPDLLTYSFFGPTIVRLALGGALIALAHRHLLARERIRDEMRGFGALAPAIASGIPASEALIGTLITIGLFTQVAALLSVVIAIKLWAAHRKYPAITSPGPLALLCMGAIALSLVVTGPGAFAFDLPL